MEAESILGEPTMNLTDGIGITTCSEAPVEERQALPSMSIGARAELDEEGLAGIAGGHTAFQLLWAGAELDLYTLLAQRPGLICADIARELKLDLQPARILLHGLTSLRVIEKTSTEYRNSRIANQCLVRGRPGCIVPLLAWQHHIVYKGMCDFTASLKQNSNVGLRHFAGCGNTLYSRLSSNPDLEAVFQASMSALSGQANAQFAATVDLSNVQRLLDLGGGDGTNAINLVRRFPHLKATVFDCATVTHIAKQKIATAEMCERVFTHTGDFLADELPCGIDAILLAHLMTIWSPERNKALLKKCWMALPRGGKLMIFNMVSNDDETGPLINALGSPYFQAIASGEGMLYCFKDYRAWLCEAGFLKTNCTTLPMEHALFIAEK